MIEVRYKPYNLRIEGHSGYSTAGSDIVCSAVSTLFFTLITALKKHEAVIEDLHVSYVSGEGQITCSSIGDGKLDLIFETILDGLKGVAESYPEYVKIISLEG